MSTVDKEAEIHVLEKVLHALVDNGFEWRGGDTFPKETVSIYMNEKLDEFVMVRFNRADAEPALIHRGTMAELDRPMDDMDSLRFVTIPEFLGHAAPRETATLHAPAFSKSAAAAFKPPAV